MQIDTTRFGRIELPEEAILRFPRGLYGLEKTRRYALLQHDEAGCFHWLQSLEDPALAMLTTDPFRFFHQYEVEIADPAAELLQVTGAAEVTTYVTVTLAGNGRQLHANLLGPVVVNHRAGLGVQVIQDASRYSTRHLITERPGKEKEDVRGRDATAIDGNALGSGRGGRASSGRPLTVPV